MEDTRPSESLPRDERISSRRDFLLAYEHGRKQFSRHTVIFVRDQELGHPRIGITATRKLGKANVRNRFRRWVREIYRHTRSGAPFRQYSVDIVVNVKPSAANVSFAEFSSDVERALMRLRVPESR